MNSSAVANKQLPVARDVPAPRLASRSGVREPAAAAGIEARGCVG